MHFETIVMDLGHPHHWVDSKPWLFNSASEVIGCHSHLQALGTNFIQVTCRLCVFSSHTGDDVDRNSEEHAEMKRRRYFIFKIIIHFSII